MTTRKASNKAFMCTEMYLVNIYFFRCVLHCFSFHNCSCLDYVSNLQILRILVWMADSSNMMWQLFCVKVIRTAMLRVVLCTQNAKLYTVILFLKRFVNTRPSIYYNGKLETQYFTHQLSKFLIFHIWIKSPNFLFSVLWLSDSFHG